MRRARGEWSAESLADALRRGVVRERPQRVNEGILLLAEALAAGWAEEAPRRPGKPRRLRRRVRLLAPLRDVVAALSAKRHLVTACKDARLMINGIPVRSFGIDFSIEGDRLALGRRS